MRRLAGEPLVHFLIAGALLFGLYRLAAGPEADPRPDRIVVGAEQVAVLAETFRRTWLRPPTSEEIERLVQDHIDEEVLYREALALGLDRDDLVVRRRLRQKMEFLHLDLLEEAAPGEEELAAFLERHPERFREPPRRDFRQVYVQRSGDDASDRQRARALLGQLLEDPGAEALGDSTLLPEAMRGADAQQVASSFGDDFAAALFALPADSRGRWQGPLASAFGFHLVRIDAYAPGRLPPLALVRGEVERELTAERRAASKRRFIDGLRGNYEVEVRMPDGLALTPEVSRR